MMSSVNVFNTSITGDTSATVEMPRSKVSSEAELQPGLSEDDARSRDSCCQMGVVYKDPDYLVIENLNVVPSWLAPCHYGAAICQCLQALFLFTFASQVDVKWCLYTNYPEITDVDSEDTDIYAVPRSAELVCYNITWYAGVFILLSGFAHIMHMVPRIRPWYEYKIERHQSPMRWVEYSFSCSLMRIYIAQVSGVTDVSTLALIFILTQSTMFYAMLHEIINAKNRADGFKQNYLPVVLAFIPNTATWGVIFAYFAQGIGKVEASLAAIIVLILFLLELSFPIVFFLQWKMVGPFKDYLIGEFAFIVLSFTTKTFLAWATVIGANAIAIKT
jgi:hypothetical protein